MQRGMVQRGGVRWCEELEMVVLPVELVALVLLVALRIWARLQVIRGLVLDGGIVRL